MLDTFVYWTILCFISELETQCRALSYPLNVHLHLFPVQTAYPTSQSFQGALPLVTDF